MYTNKKGVTSRLQAAVFKWRRLIVSLKDAIEDMIQVGNKAKADEIASLRGHFYIRIYILYIYNIIYIYI